MTDELDAIEADIAERLRPAEFVQRLGDRVGARMTAAAVFGEPVEREGITVIPVARVAWGFGGGSGLGDEDARGHGEGAGGGGGGLAAPIGHIEIRAGEAEFKPLRPGPPAPVLAAAAGAFAVVAARLLRR